MLLLMVRRLAMEASKEETQSPQRSQPAPVTATPTQNAVPDDEEEQLRLALALSSQPSQQHTPVQAQPAMDDEDAQLQMALRLSSLESESGAPVLASATPQAYFGMPQPATPQPAQSTQRVQSSAQAGKYWAAQSRFALLAPENAEMRAFCTML